MLADHFRAMARNNAWSNHRLLAACGRLSPEAYLAPRIGFFPSIHLTLNHILIVDWYYIDALEAGGLGPRAYEDETPCADFSALEQAQRDADRRLIAWCDAADEARLVAPVILVRAQGRRHEERAGDVLAHLFVHQIHHRGQVHAMLSGSDVPPPQLDEFFLRQDAHLRAEELAELARRGLG